VPFRDAITREKHFLKHRHKFLVALANAVEYERMADNFLDGPMDADTKECQRRQANDRLRFNHTTLHIGIACLNPVYVRTFYPVDVANVNASGGAQNYFRYKCREMSI